MELIYKEEAFKIIGICMEIHTILKNGLLEIVYKDALEYEFKKHKIPFTREKEFEIEYKDIVLPHKFYADFVVYDDIVLEIKAQRGFADENIKQILNYIAIAKSRLGILINFGEADLKYKRFIL